jgi:hypothetical protein
MILVVLIILLFILLRWYTNNYEKYELGTDSYDIQVKPVEILDVEYYVGQSGEVLFKTYHLRFNPDNQTWDLYQGSSQDYVKDTTLISKESIFTVKYKNILDGKTGKSKQVPSYEYTYESVYYNYILEETGDVENPILNFSRVFNWGEVELFFQVPLNDLYVPIDPPTFDTSISNTNLDVTASFTNVINPSSKYTVSIHDKTTGNEIISYPLNESKGETFSLNWKENSPGTKKYTVKLNGRTHSSDHDITIDGDDSDGIYKINKINFKWNNTNGVNETVEKWVIVVKKDGYAPLETKNIVKDDTNFFKNFTDTPNVELLKGYAFKSSDDISGIKIYLYYVDKNGIKTLLSTSEDLKLNREDFNMEISKGFEPLVEDTFTSRTWDDDIYTDYNKNCDAKFYKDGDEYTCDDNADYKCQNWKYTISTLGIGDGIPCIKDNNEIITVNWPSVNTLINYSSFDKITDDDKNPNKTGTLVDDPTMYAKSFEEYRNVDGNNLDCVGSWERDGDLTENCEGKEYLTCQDWKYNVTRERTGTGKECGNNDSDELTVKYPSSDAMTLYLPPDDIVKWETVDDLNPNKSGALIGSSDMYVKPFEDYKNSYTATEPGIQKELKIKESDIYRVAGGTSDGQLGYSVDVNDKYTIVGQPGNNNGTIYTYDNEDDEQIYETVDKSYQVAMSDNHAISGAYKENKVYIYDINDKGNLGIVKVLDGGKAEVLTTTNRFVYNNPPNSEFGKSVAISDDYAVVTVPQATVELSSDAYTASRTYTPIIYIYEKDFDGNWETRKEITEDYGDTIAVSGNTIIIGGDNKVYIYERNSNGEWDKTQTIEGTGSFGQSVSILDDYMLIGAPDNNGSESGAYLYQNKGGDNPWKQIGEKIIHEDVDGIEFGRFGSSVSLSDEYAIITTLYSVYIYKRIYGKLDKGTKVPLSITGGQIQTSISNKYAAIGAYKEEGNKGAMYIIDLSNVEYEEIEIAKADESAPVKYVWVGYEPGKVEGAVEDWNRRLSLHKIKVMSGGVDIVKDFGKYDNNIDKNPKGVTFSSIHDTYNYINGSTATFNPEAILFKYKEDGTGGDGSWAGLNFFSTSESRTGNWVKMELDKGYKVSEIEEVEVINIWTNYNSDRSKWTGTFVKLLDFDGNEIRRSNENVPTSTYDARIIKIQKFTFPTDDENVKYIWVGYDDNPFNSSLILSGIRVFVDNKNIISGLGKIYGEIETSSFKEAYEDDDTKYEKKKNPEQVLCDGNLVLNSTYGGTRKNYYATGITSDSNWIKIKLPKSYKMKDIQKVEVHAVDGGTGWAGTFVKFLDYTGKPIAESTEKVPDNGSGSDSVSSKMKKFESFENIAPVILEKEKRDFGVTPVLFNSIGIPN